MKKVTCTFCLTVGLVLGFNTASSSQRFEGGKSYVYNEALPETDYVMKLVIEIGRDGKTYKATILSGKYKYTCPKGKILSQEKLESVKCQSLIEKDADGFLIAGNEFVGPTQLLQGSLKEPTRIITGWGIPEEANTWENQQYLDKVYYFGTRKLFTTSLNGSSPEKVKSKGKGDQILQKLRKIQKLLDQKLISPADATYKRRQILDTM